MSINDLLVCLNRLTTDFSKQATIIINWTNLCSPKCKSEFHH